MKKLLVISSNTIHVYSFIKLISDYFDEILLISDQKNNEFQVKTVVVDFSLKKLKNYIKTVKSIRNTINTFKPSVIHIHQVSSVSYFAFKALGGNPIKTVLTAWGSDILLAPNRNFLIRRLVKKSLTRADFLTADSIYMTERMQELCKSKKLSMAVVNFGIELHDVPLNKEKIIYSNRLHKPLYRIDKIILAFSDFIKNTEFKDWKLLIAATGSENENLKKLVVDLKIDSSVEFCGWVNQKENINNYAKSTIYVSIPESDATSISLLEAMAYGCFPVVSDLPSNKEWIKHTTNGFIVKNNQLDFFSDVLNLDFEKTKIINKNIVLERATIEANRAIFISIYKQLGI